LFGVGGGVRRVRGEFVELLRVGFFVVELGAFVAEIPLHVATIFNSTEDRAQAE
jgi:hypothetical protein